MIENSFLFELYSYKWCSGYVTTQFQMTVNTSWKEIQAIYYVPITMPYLSIFVILPDAVLKIHYIVTSRIASPTVGPFKALRLFVTGGYHLYVWMVAAVKLPIPLSGVYFRLSTN